MPTTEWGKKSQANTKKLNNSVEDGGAVFVPQNMGGIVKNTDMLNNDASTLYTDGCATCIGICIVGDEYSYLGHLDDDSNGKCAAILDAMFKQFDDVGASIESVHISSDSAFDTYSEVPKSVIGKEVFSHLSEATNFDVLTVHSLATMSLDVENKKLVCTGSNLAKPKIMDVEVYENANKLVNGSIDINDLDPPNFMDFKTISTLADDVDGALDADGNVGDFGQGPGFGDGTQADASDTDDASDPTGDTESDAASMEEQENEALKEAPSSPAMEVE